MSATGAVAAADAAAFRALVLARPGLILDDAEVMRALIEADGVAGRNVVDLRGALVKRLETRLARLEETHRSVIAAAYENLAGVSQVHRAALALLEAPDLPGFLRAIVDDAPRILSLDVARLAVESEGGLPAALAALPPDLAAHVVALPPEGVAAYLALDGGDGRDGVWLRAAPPEAELLYGEEAGAAGSEALMTLDLGGGRRGLLALGASDPARFSPEHGADLVAFLGGVVERGLRRLLA
jgi:uncharacterized protein YigA (DUF484 family)